MKPTLEDLRRSAEFCGKRFAEPHRPEIICIWEPIGENRTAVRWNPPESAEQDRELLHKLLEAGYSVSYREVRHKHFEEPGHVLEQHTNKWTSYDKIDCRPNDFLTLAASKLQEMRDD